MSGFCPEYDKECSNDCAKYNLTYNKCNELIQTEMLVYIKDHPSQGGSFQFPVGAVYINVSGVSPATELGYGTWSQIAGGKVLIGQTGSDADFNVAEETGGSKTHTLTEAELASHTHVQNQHRHQILRERSATTGSQTTQIARTADTSSTLDTNVYTEYTIPTNQNTGSGTAFSVMNPYFVAYIWKRTA